MHQSKLRIICDIDDQWDKLKGAIHTAANEVIRTDTRNQRRSCGMSNAENQIREKMNSEEIDSEYVQLRLQEAIKVFFPRKTHKRSNILLFVSRFLQAFDSVSQKDLGRVFKECGVTVKI